MDYDVVDAAKENADLGAMSDDEKADAEKAEEELKVSVHQESLITHHSSLRDRSPHEA